MAVGTELHQAIRALVAEILIVLMVQFRPAALFAPRAAAHFQEAAETFPAGKGKAPKIFGGEPGHDRGRD
jgi:hypothetical protein